jgi:hypothetical protein
MVFKARSERASDAVFLLGRVVRKQAAPNQGLGLRWEKAILDGPPEALARALESLLKYKAKKITRQPVGRKGLVRSVCLFEDPAVLPVVEFKPEPGSAETTDRIMSRQDAPLTIAEVDALDVRFVTSAAMADEEEPSVLPRESSRTGPQAVKGPITSRIDNRDLMAKADIGGLLAAGSKSIPILITYLGLHGAFVETKKRFDSPENKLIVSFGIVSRGGVVQVKGVCKVSEVDDGTVTGTPGVELTVEAWDEAGHPGIIKQYLKWLHFDALSSC